MDYTRLLPPEILMKIFLELSINDLENVEKTCLYWNDVIEEQKIWQIQWKLMLNSLNKSIIKPKIYNNLKEKTFNKTVSKEAINRLKNIVYGTENNKCFFNRLDTKQHSRALIRINTRIIKILSFILRQYRRRPDFLFNKIHHHGFPRCLNNLMQIYGHHTHRQKLYFCYTMETGHLITKELIKYLFEEMHVMKIVFLPTNLFCSFGFDCLNSVVVYSSEDGTEVSVILDCKIVRWKQLWITEKDIIKDNTLNTCQILKYTLFDKVIMDLITGLKTEEINTVMQAVYFIGPFLQYTSIIAKRLQDELRIKYPECSATVNVFRSSVGISHRNGQVLHCPMLQVSTTKFVPGIPYSVNFTDYVLDGLQHFDS